MTAPNIYYFFNLENVVKTILNLAFQGKQRLNYTLVRITLLPETLCPGHFGKSDPLVLS